MSKAFFTSWITYFDKNLKTGDIIKIKDITGANHSLVIECIVDNTATASDEHITITLRRINSESKWMWNNTIIDKNCVVKGILV